MTLCNIVKELITKTWFIIDKHKIYIRDKHIQNHATTGINIQSCFVCFSMKKYEPTEHTCIGLDMPHMAWDILT